MASDPLSYRDFQETAPRVRLISNLAVLRNLRVLLLQTDYDYEQPLFRFFSAIVSATHDFFRSIPKFPRNEILCGVIEQVNQGGDSQMKVYKDK